MKIQNRHHLSKRKRHFNMRAAQQILQVRLGKYRRLDWCKELMSVVVKK
ncbi:hypothetical protein [Agarilytica rhodophyticola]|nr:hypothetical protein [Agarilytica rhodophyticola]